MQSTESSGLIQVGAYVQSVRIGFTCCRSLCVFVVIVAEQEKALMSPENAVLARARALYLFLSTLLSRPLRHVYIYADAFS